MVSQYCAMDYMCYYAQSYRCTHTTTESENVINIKYENGNIRKAAAAATATATTALITPTITAAEPNKKIK